jgi:glycosyltransferase involved in cell wall biosynthesis
MRIVHIVSSISSTNFGVWNAAIFGSTYLKKTYNVDSDLWVCSRTRNDTLIPEIPFRYFNGDQMGGRGLKIWISMYSKKDTIFVTHGSWLKPTQIGYRAKKSGYKWIYLPQGMFEPWAMKNDWLKKKIYFELFEKRMCQKADVIRAVSKPEESNLKRLFNTTISLIYNGVNSNPKNNSEKPSFPLVYLFLARLHHKKGIYFLVKAWKNVMNEKVDSKLMIVGPDEGELKRILPYINNNIEYLGPLFGKDKERILQSAHYYVLPSFSEGFPSSVVEAMSFGAIPIISEGCNFPDVFKEQLGYEIKPEEESIERALTQISNKAFDNKLSNRNILFVKQNLTDNIIGDQLFSLYKNLIL